MIRVGSPDEPASSSGPWASMAAVLSATGWRTVFDSYDGSFVAIHPEPSTGIRVTGRTAGETIERVLALLRNVAAAGGDGALKDELVGLMIDKEGLELQIADLERRSGMRRTGLVVAP